MLLTGSPFKINRLQQLSLSRHVYNVRSLVAVIPSGLCAESGSHDFADSYDHLDQPVSVLINVSGKLLMIQQDRSACIEKSKVNSILLPGVMYLISPRVAGTKGPCLYMSYGTY